MTTMSYGFTPCAANRRDKTRPVGSEVARTIILYGLVNFRFRVHDKRSITHDRLTQLLCGDQQQAGGRCRFRSDEDHVAVRQNRMIATIELYCRRALSHMGHPSKTLIKAA